jgi:tetratricopeptide (TPR) repeat protein
VKLDPTAWEAWNALGSVLFKKRDLRGSLDAFDASAAIKPNIPALRDASIVLRQVPDRSAVVENIRLSVVKAKAAVALDLKNVETWTVLGTAHLATYFAVSRDVDDLQRANQAYHRAATLEAALLSGGGARPDAPKPRVPGSWEPVAPRPDPDLHYNRGQAFTFQEAYDAAIQEYLMTLATDPQLPAKVRYRGGLSACARRGAAAFSRLPRSGEPREGADSHGPHRQPHCAQGARQDEAPARGERRSCSSTIGR